VYRQASEHDGEAVAEQDEEEGGMRTYLLTWNPRRWPWGDLAHEAGLHRKGKETTGYWSCGNSKSIKPGDRFFLLRQGQPPRGIVASGRITSAPHGGEHWDDDKRKKGVPARYVDLRFEALLDPDKEPPLGVAALTRGPLTKIHWRTQMSGIRVPDDAAAVLEKLWAAHVAKLRASTADQHAGMVRERDEAPVGTAVDESELLRRVTVNPAIFGGKPILRGRRLAVEHVLGMLAAGDSPEAILKGYSWLGPEDIQACLVYARRIVANERIEPLIIEQP
jgi:uncharacterized protein (DUF433 family)